MIQYVLDHLEVTLKIISRARVRVVLYTDESIYSFITSFWSYVVQSTSILGLDSDLDLEPPILVGIFGSD
jgi:hypothetical protein